MWITISILFMILSMVLSILLFYSLRRINQYENLILQFQQIITFATEKIKLVDSKGHYESDDETSFFFEELKELQELLNNIFESETSEKNNG